MFHIINEWNYICFNPVTAIGMHDVCAYPMVIRLSVLQKRESIAGIEW